jgi:PPP family 3-phenylpropionic acid transporter
MLRDPAFIAVLAAASLIQASHAVFYGFSAVQWRGAGLEGTTIAALWALGVAAEIVLFALSGRLPPFFTPTMLLIVAAIGGVLRWAGMAFDPPVYILPWLQLLHALTFGAAHLGALGFVARFAPPGQAATALSRHRARPRHGRLHGNLGRALCRLRQPRLLGDGASVDRWRRLRRGSVSSP